MLVLYKKEKNIDDDLFAMHLDYTVSNTETQAVTQYNGNISQATWRVRGDVNKSVYGFNMTTLTALLKQNTRNMMRVTLILIMITIPCRISLMTLMAIFKALIVWDMTVTVIR